jgi:hypothetical protein
MLNFILNAKQTIEIQVVSWSFKTLAQISDKFRHSAAHIIIRRCGACSQPCPAAHPRPRQGPRTSATFLPYSLIIKTKVEAMSMG